jgi:hypothetical protein
MMLLAPPPQLDLWEPPAPQELPALPPPPFEENDNAIADMGAEDEFEAGAPDRSVALFGYDLFGEIVNQRVNSVLGRRFLLPPFSVLSAREGWWQDRKRAWLSMGLRSEIGRDELLTFSQSAQPPAVYEAKNLYQANVGRVASWDEFYAANPDVMTQRGTSVFDPVLCELAYRWFCPPAGLVLDPFAGGSVRGIVAAMLGRRYCGIDLSGAQLEANRAQAALIVPEAIPDWRCGDSRNLLPGTPEANFIFSCPPYGDLEVYSDDPADLSTMDFERFRDAYFEIIGKACMRLRADSFAAWVVGDYRDENGALSNLPGMTIEAFRDAGLSLYNEAVLVTAVGSLPIRVSRQFSGSRKLGKTHQNLYVFLKGDARRAAAACEQAAACE